MQAQTYPCHGVLHAIVLVSIACVDEFVELLANAIPRIRICCDYRTFGRVRESRLPY